MVFYYHILIKCAYKITHNCFIPSEFTIWKIGKKPFTPIQICQELKSGFGVH